MGSLSLFRVICHADVLLLVKAQNKFRTEGMKFLLEDDLIMSN
jgi:hypothetical protein